MKVVRLFISEGHNYFGHHGRASGSCPTVEETEIHCLAGRGIRGDRFFDHAENYKGQITFFEEETYDALCRQFGVFHKGPAAFRRNVLTRDIDLNTWIGVQFEVQGIRFEGIEECRPCYWMNEAFCPGTEEALRGRGGLRARILTSGILTAQGSPSAVSQVTSAPRQPELA